MMASMPFCLSCGFGRWLRFLHQAFITILYKKHVLEIHLACCVDLVLCRATAAGFGLKILILT